MARPRFDRGPVARKTARKRIWRSLRYVLALGAILLAWQVWGDPRLRSMIGLPMEQGDLVTERFVACDAPGYASNCAVDGDTFRIGNRRIRIEGIDAPEREGRCEAESEASRLATRALTNWLDAGPFLMLAEGTVPRDQYGRELQSVWRVTDDGSHQDLARHLISAGHAQSYIRGSRPDWCD